MVKLRTLAEIAFATLGMSGTLGGGVYAMEGISLEQTARTELALIDYLCPATGDSEVETRASKLRNYYQQLSAEAIETRETGATIMQYSCIPIGLAGLTLLIPRARKSS